MDHSKTAKLSRASDPVLQSDQFAIKKKQSCKQSSFQGALSEQDKNIKKNVTMD